MTFTKIEQEPLRSETKPVPLKILPFNEWPWVKWIELGTDMVSLQLALLLGYLVCRSADVPIPLELPSEKYLKLAVGLLFIPVGYWLAQIYPGYGLTLVERLRRRVQATLFFFLIFMAWDFFVNIATHSRGMLLITFLFSLIIPSVAQYYLRRLLIHMNYWGIPVFVLGAHRIGQQIVSTLLKNKILGLNPVAIFDDEITRWGSHFAGIPVIGGIDGAEEYVGKLDYVLLSISDEAYDRQVELVGKLQSFIIIFIPDLTYDQSILVESLDIEDIICLEIQKNLIWRGNSHLKSIMDYALGIPLFLLSVPLIVLFAVCIFLSSPGNPFFFQVREGKDGKEFKLWKLRTMYPNSDKFLNLYLEANPLVLSEWKTYFKLKNDPRIIKGIGNLLRKTSLDELPQLWNVLRGEMSLVGPRPFPHYHLEQFNAKFRYIRRSVLPGMTGLWQVSVRSNGNLMIQENLDTYYIRNWSFWLDLSLFFRTIWIVITGKGAY